MKEDNKELVFSDIAIYLPYVLKVLWTKRSIDETMIVETRTAYEGVFRHLHNSAKIMFVDSKPLLRPMSSMTQWEKDEYRNNGGYQFVNDMNDNAKYNFESLNWLAKNMFDFGDLIGQGKALNLNDYKIND